MSHERRPVVSVGIKPLSALPDTPTVVSLDAGDARISAPAALRNREPIADVLSTLLPSHGTILEVGSGTGEHICYFAKRFGGLVWQPTECDSSRLASIKAWSRHLKQDNLRPPAHLDIFEHIWPIPAADAVIAINVLHVSPPEAITALFAGASQLLPTNGLLYVYGPFRCDGQHTSIGNAEFDQALRVSDPALGIRDLEDVIQSSIQHGFDSRHHIVPMPANNLSVAFRYKSSNS